MCACDYKRVNYIDFIAKQAHNIQQTNIVTNFVFLVSCFFFARLFIPFFFFLFSCFFSSRHFFLSLFVCLFIRIIIYN